MAHVLEALMLLEEPGGQRRTFDPIIRPADGSRGWRTLDQCMEAAEVAALVAHPGQIIGIRHRHYSRLIVQDIDNKPGHPSPYWHPAGPDHSPALQQLLSAAEAAGIASALFRTPSGGWHVWLSLPTAVHHSVAARVGLALARRAGMEVRPGVLEVFPNLTAWSPGSDAKHWKHCHGFRLPGQAGGAVWLGHGWSSEPEDCWAEAEAAADLAAGNVTAAWEELLAEAAAIRPHRPAPAAGAHHRRRPRREHGIRWTGPRESNHNLGKIATALYQAGEDCESFGRRIAAAARSAAGFDQHASDDTKQRLDQWALGWAACCIRRPPTASARQRRASADPGRNHRLHREAVAKVIDAALVVAREHGAAALRWSERLAAEVIGLARDTYRKLKNLWRLRLTAAVYAVRPRGLHPAAKGVTLRCASGAGGGAELLRRDPAAGSAINPSLHPIPPPTSAVDQHHAAPPPAVPMAPARSPSPRREAERLELLAWLGLAPG